MKFFTGSTIKINKGDALEFTKTLEDKSVDLIIIDPPYKLEMPEKKNVSTLSDVIGIWVCILYLS